MNLRGFRRAETIGISAGCAVDGNEPPEHYESVALPAELHQRGAIRREKYDTIVFPRRQGGIFPPRQVLRRRAYAGAGGYYGGYSCSAAVIFPLVILPERQARRSAGMEGVPSPFDNF